MYKVFGLGLALAGLLFSGSASARCGLFDSLAGDDYCIKCPSARPEKIYLCPGGAPGFAIAQVSRPNCSIAFYDPTCGDRARAKRRH